MRSALHAAVLAVTLLTLAVSEATGQERRVPASEPSRPDSLIVYLLDPLLVEGRIDDLVGLASTASEGFVGSRDLLLRPLTREGELLETVPGMIVTQHSGSGKSNQMYVRGFNLDHGTDFSTRLEGMPLNLPTHAHGQGYTDLNFLIPELVDHVEYALGNYYPEIGDFGSAGGAHIRLRRSLAKPLFVLASGEGGFRRVVGAASRPIGSRGALMAAGEARRYDGPWEKPEDARKLSGALRYTWQGETSNISLLALGYDNSWQASDQIPRRAVEAGTVGRYGQVDPTLGGDSQRYSLSGAWTRSTGRSSQRIEAYAVRYGLDLFSNFTYLLDDPEGGDQFRQRDDGRLTLGLHLAHLRPLGSRARPHSMEVGADVRRDVANLTLSRTRLRTPTETVRADVVTQWSGGGYARLESRWSRKLRSTLGLRADAYRFEVGSDRPSNSGISSSAIVSPKASFAWAPHARAELYASAGLGFHSNDARGTVTTVDPVTETAVEPVDPLVRSEGAEVGMRATPTDGLRITAAIWGVDLDSELLFVGDAGTTEASAPSRRIGVTLTSFTRLPLSLTADADVSLTRARFRGAASEGARIPGAVESVVAAGLGREPENDGAAWSLRLRRLGAYPLVVDDSQRSRASTLVHVNIGYKVGSARITLSVLNLLDSEQADVEYFYRSRLPGEALAGLADVHFHPAEPRQLRVSLAWGTSGG